jgi:hypothetical protein
MSPRGLFFFIKIKKLGEIWTEALTSPLAETELVEHHG